MKILVIDDEKNIRSTLSGVLQDEGHQVAAKQSGEDGLNHLADNPADLVFLDIKLPGIDGIEVLKRIKKEYPETDVLMISGNSDIETAVQAVKLGAYDFMEKPLSLPKINISVQNIAAKRQLSQKYSLGAQQTDSRYRIIGESPQIKAIQNMIRRVAKSDSKILITGESGTGKELVAYAIHKLSQRSEGPFVTYNSAAIPRELVESELFGHEKGAFTGAFKSKAGKLEMANGGTIFLDEIGDMHVETQSKILRVIEENSLQRIGGNKTIMIDVRILAATNRNLEKMVTKGTFREDLYYRLNVVPIHLPPLRERSGDIAILIDYYLSFFARELAVPRKRLSEEARAKLAGYDFPGNIRELKNLIERLYMLTEGPEIGIETLEPNLYGIQKGATEEQSLLETDNYNDAKRAFEKRYFTEKLRQADWNISQAAREMGLQQPNLSRKIKELGIDIRSE